MPHGIPAWRKLIGDFFRFSVLLVKRLRTEWSDRASDRAPFTAGMDGEQVAI